MLGALWGREEVRGTAVGEYLCLFKGWGSEKAFWGRIGVFGSCMQERKGSTNGLRCIVLCEKIV